jgi:hypothetical protein
VPDSVEAGPTGEECVYYWCYMLHILQKEFSLSRSVVRRAADRRRCITWQNSLWTLEGVMAVAADVHCYGTP